MDPELKRLQAELATRNNEVVKAITSGDLALAETASAAADEIKSRLDARKADLDKLAAIKARADETARYLSEPQHQVPVPGGKKGLDVRTIETEESEVDKYAPTGGFQNAGHFLKAVRGIHLRDEGAIESVKKWNDIQVKAPAGMFEEADPDGGILVPRQFSNTIYERLSMPTRLFSRLSPIRVSGNNISIPALKEDSRVAGSRHGGVQSYWDGEADSFTASRPKFRKLELKLHKLTALVAVTEELLADSSVALESYLGRLVPDEFDFKINDAIINGNGIGMPLGILNSGSKITQAAVSGQGAATIVYANIVAMHSRMLASARSSAVWLINQDTEPQLEALFLATGTAHGNPIYLPSGVGNWASDLSRLKGKPVVPVEQCATLGTEGDIILVSFDGIACIIKGAVESAMSMHVYFTTQEMAYRWSFRMDSQPYDNVALTPFKGTATRSHIITLNSTRT